MEKLKVKHDHKLTDIIKVGIFAIFLLLPIMVWLPSALYYGFNEHAKVPEETNVIYNYKYETNQVNNYEDLINGNVYKLKLNNKTIGNLIQNGYFTFELLSNLNVSTLGYNDGTAEIPYFSANTFIQFEDTGYGSMYIYTYFSKLQYEEYDYTNIYDYTSTFNNDIYIKFIECSQNVAINLIEESDYNEIESVTLETDETPTISTKMYKSWQDVWTQPVFNWTGNNNFAFTINTFSQIFGITEQSYIANYINYLMTLTAIYIIFDIILSVFVKLTHMFNGQ